MAEPHWKGSQVSHTVSSTRPGNWRYTVDCLVPLSIAYPPSWCRVGSVLHIIRPSLADLDGLMRGQRSCRLIGPLKSVAFLREWAQQWYQQSPAKEVHKLKEYYEIVDEAHPLSGFVPTHHETKQASKFHSDPSSNCFTIDVWK